MSNSTNFFLELSNNIDDADRSSQIESVIEQAYLNSTIDNKTLLSNPAFLYSYPEVKNLESKFIYNFFEKNERKITIDQNESSSNITLQYDEDFADIDFLLSSENNNKKPRYVQLTFAKPNSDNSENNITNQELTIVRQADLNNILIEASEGNLKNHLFGIELTDRGTEQKVIDKLKQSSVIITDTPTNDISYQELANQTTDLIDSGQGMVGIGKKIFLEKINAIKGQGFAISSGENNEALSTDPISYENFNIKINKLFVKETIKYATTKNTGLFEEELTSLATYTENLRNNAINNILLSGGVDAISERDQAVVANPIDIVSALSEFSGEFVPSSKLAGYLIEKIEQLPDETLISRKTVFIANPNQNAYNDTKVRYGGKYLYKVRAVYLVTAETILLNPNDPSGLTDQAVIARYLIANQGSETKVFCTENIPPKPPARIRCRFDFKVKKPVICWQFPINKQRDIKRFQVFKRRSKDTPFVLIAEYNFDNSINPVAVKEIAQSKNLFNLNPKVPKLFHLDTTFNLNETPIYAVAAVDAHGLSSNLSTQLKVKYEKFENKLHVKLFSREGAPKQYPNFYIEEDTFLDCIKTSGSNRMIVFFDPEYYKVFKNNGTDTSGNLIENDLNHIAANPLKSTYKIQIINLDQQKDKTVNIRIEDASSSNATLANSSFNVFRNNNFQN